MVVNALHEGHPLFTVNLWIAGTSLPQTVPAFELGLIDRIIIANVRTYGFVARISRETPGASGRGVLKGTIFHEQTVANFLGTG